MANKLIYIPNDDTQNYPFFRVQLVGETFGRLNKPIKIQLKSPKLLSKRIRTGYYKTLGTKVNDISKVNTIIEKDIRKIIKTLS